MFNHATWMFGCLTDILLRKNTALFIAEKKLKAICAENGETANQNVFTFFYDYL